MEITTYPSGGAGAGSSEKYRCFRHSSAEGLLSGSYSSICVASSKAADGRSLKKSVVNNCHNGRNMVETHTVRILYETLVSSFQVSSKARTKGSASAQPKLSPSAFP